MVDYIIVGCGLAGISFAEQALNNNNTIVVFDNDSQKSSRIAGGLYNPVILKRFSEVWEAEKQLIEMKRFYKKVEDKLAVQFDFPKSILRKFFSIEEQNNWFAASDKRGLAPFLSPTLITKKYSGIDSPYNYGEVLHTGYVDTASLLKEYKKHLESSDSIRYEAFDYSSLKIDKDTVTYNGITAKHIVFAEGFGIHQNPFFSFLPVDGTKGELFIIESDDLKLDVILNTSVFILPLGANRYKVGATYNWKDKTDLPTEEGKLELLERIREIIDCDFKIIEHFAGVRPTVYDRRPLIGTHADYNNVHVLNGLGTRGVMLGPSMARELFDKIENGKTIERDINIQRVKPKNYR
jgi:glycine/D-amino acid oxidase-like deaminating enzyme